MADHRIKIQTGHFSSQPERPERNGFIEVSALIIFSLMLVLCGYISVLIGQSAGLRLADRQSALDLKLYAEAMNLASEWSYQKRCSGSLEKPRIEKKVNGIAAVFEDQDHRLAVSYQHPETRKNIVFYLSYDENGPAGLTYEK